MSGESDQLDAICAVLEQKLESAPPVAARRLLRPQLRWVAQQLEAGTGESLAIRLGVVELVESCRNEHLASLDADEGLTVLSIDWRDIVLRSCERARTNDRRRRCPRCGEPMLAEQLRGTRLRYRCSPCRLVRKER